MLEDKIDETNKLLHKIANEVFPSVFASFENLDRRLTKLEDFFYHLDDDEEEEHHNSEEGEQTQNDIAQSDSEQDEQGQNGQSPLSYHIQKMSIPQKEDKMTAIDSIRTELMKSLDVFKLDEKTPEMNGLSDISPEKQSNGYIGNDTEAAKSIKKLDQVQNKQIEKVLVTDGITSEFVEVVFESGTIVRIDDIPVTATVKKWPFEAVQPKDNITKLFERFYFSRFSFHNTEYILYQDKLPSKERPNSFYINVGQRLTMEEMYTKLLNGGFDGIFLEYTEDDSFMMDNYSEYGYQCMSGNTVFKCFSKSYSIRNFDQVFEFFDVGDKLFEATSYEYQKDLGGRTKWPDKSLRKDVPVFILELFNWKYFHSIDDRRIIIFLENKIQKEYPTLSGIEYDKLRKVIPKDIFNKDTKMIDWERLLVQAYVTEGFKRKGKAFIVKYLNVMKERRTKVGRGAKNFDMLFQILDAIKDNIEEFMMTSSEVVAILTLINTAFEFEIQYLTVFNGHFSDFNEFTLGNPSLYNQDLKIFHYKLPEEFLHFLNHVSDYYDSQKEEIKACFLLDLQAATVPEEEHPAYIQFPTPHAIEYEHLVEARMEVLKDYPKETVLFCQLNSRYWDDCYSDNLLFLTFNVNDFKKYSGVQNRWFIKYLHYEVTEYLNLLPMVIEIKLTEWFSDPSTRWWNKWLYIQEGPKSDAKFQSGRGLYHKWDMSYLKKKTLVISSEILIHLSSELSKDILELMLKFPYWRLAKGAINLEEMMVDLLMNFAAKKKVFIVNEANILMLEARGAYKHLRVINPYIPLLVATGASTERTRREMERVLQNLD